MIPSEKKLIPKAAPGHVFAQPADAKKVKTTKSKLLGSFDDSTSGYLPMRLPYHEKPEVSETQEIISSNKPMLIQMPCSLPFKDIQKM